MNKKILFWIIAIVMLLITVGAAQAQPPVTSVFEGNEGLSVEASPPRFLKIGDTGATEVHVFNISNGRILNDSLAECNSVVQWPNGSQIVDIMATPHLDHFNFELDLENITLIGEYGYTIHCNTSDLGGFLSGYFELTRNGNNPDLGEPIAFILGLGILLAVVALVYFKLNSEEDWLLRLAILFFFPMILMIFASFMVSASLGSLFFTAGDSTFKTILLFVRGFYIYLIGKIFIRLFQYLRETGKLRFVGLFPKGKLK